MANIAGAISIGRNVKDTPLPDAQWQRFIFEVQSAIDLAGGTIYATAYGRGEWQGVSEDNAVVTFGDVPEHVIPELRLHLGWLAEDHSQDAIALLTGESVLIGAGGVAA